MADFGHRYHKLKGASGTIFSTGTDEHGLKIQRAAVAAGKDPQIFCDEVSKEFKVSIVQSCPHTNPALVSCIPNTTEYGYNMVHIHTCYAGYDQT